MILREPSPNSQLVVKGNQSLTLDDPQTVWLIESGSLALFAVAVKDGVAEGARRYLFSVADGEALFGMTPDDKPYRIIAVSVTQAIVRKLTPENCDNSQPIVAELIPLAVKWSQQFTTFPGVVSASTISDLWVIQNWEKLQSHLQNLQVEFYRSLEELQQLEHAAKLAQFQERQRLNRQATLSAVGELASVLKPQPVEFFPQATPLLIAAGAVGKALGITIRPPARSEDMKRVKNPLDAIARASRMRIRKVVLSGLWWKKDCGPLLAYMAEDNRPVALLSVGGTKYDIFDPQDRTRTPVNPPIAKQLAPIAYTFYRPLPNKALNALDIFQFTLRGRSKDIIFLVLTGVAATLLGMLTPQATSILIDMAIPDSDRGLLLQIGIGLLAASFGNIIFRFAQGLTTLRLRSINSAATQAALWDRLLNLRVSFFRQYTTGDLQSRVTAVAQINSILDGTVMRTLFTSFFALLNLALLFYYSAPLALVAVVVGLLTGVVTIVSGVITRRKLRPLQELQGKIFGLMVQLIGGVSKLRVAAAEERAFAYWSKNYSQQLKLILSTQVTEDLVNLFNTILPTVSSIVLFILAALLLQESASTAELSAGKFLAFNTAFGTFISGATDLSNTLIDILEVPILWERAKPILDAKPEVDLNKADPGRISGQVQLDRVSFRYREDGPLILENVTIAAQPQEFIALVGPSGSGKSTIIRLLLGFETPEAGKIYYDGQDLSGLDLSALRRQLGVVLQNGRINSASIFDHITGGALVTMDEAWEAAEMAGFADDIKAMPMGMHTIISEGGTNISGGQRQRLSIARSLVLKPRILIFDEATSALDNRTQAIVTESIDKLRVTRIVIAHRLSTIRKADRIYVIEAGRVVQQGNFEELAAMEGLFANLMARQMA